MKRKLKILYSLPHPADRLGNQGAGHVVRATALLDALQSLGHEVIRLEASTSSEAKLSVHLYRKLIRNIIPKAIALKMRDAARIRYGKKYALRLIEKAKEIQPDLILETHIAFSLAGKIASETLGIPLVLDDCSPAWEEEQQYSVGLKEEARKIYREVTDWASLIVAVNQTMKNNLIAEGITPAKLITVENGFDSKSFNAKTDGNIRRTELRIPEDKKIILFVGSFQPYHKVNMLIEAFNMMKYRSMAHLLLVGFGREFEASKALVEKLSLLEEVTFTGHVAYPDIPSYIALGTFAVMPATNDYGNPMKIYEYMAMGKAVVAPNQPTIFEIATHQSDSLLFEPNNVQALSNTLDELVINKDACIRLGLKGSEIASQHSWERRATRLQDAFYDIL